MASAAVIAALRELVADGLSVTLCTEQLNHRFQLGVTERQVRRWREKSIKIIWKGSDAELDRVVLGLLNGRELGDDEGYRWVHSVVNEQLGPLRVGRDRVAAAIRRVAPAQVTARLKIVEKRLIRRVQHYRFYGEVEATDLNCKATFGKVKLLVSGLVSRSQP